MEKKIMKERLNNWPSFFRISRFFWIALVVLALAFFAEKIYQTRSGRDLDPGKLEQIVADQDRKLAERLQELSINWDSEIGINQRSIPDISVFIFTNDSLIQWSDNSIVLPEEVEPSLFSPGFIVLPNLYGLCRTTAIDSVLFVAILPIQYNFPFENEFLSNAFLLGGSRYSNCTLTNLDSEQGEIIHGTDGAPWFKIVTQKQGRISFLWICSVIFYSLGLFLVIVFMLDLLGMGQGIWRSSWWLLFFIIDLTLLRWVLDYFNWPGIFFNGKIFDQFSDPLLFFESLGESIISLGFLLTFAYALNKYWRVFPESLLKSKTIPPRTIDAFTAFAWLIVSVLWVIFFSFSNWILHQSGELLELHKILSLDLSDFLALFIIGLSGSIILVITFTVAKQVSVFSKFPRFLLLPIVIGLIVFSMTKYSGYGPSNFSQLFYLLIILSSSLTFFGNTKSLAQISVLLILLFSSAFIVYLIEQQNNSKERTIQVELIDALTNEHDEIAEMLLGRIDEEIISDSALLRMVQNPEIPEVDIENYVISNKLGPYWNRYLINVMVCDSVNLLSFSTGNAEVVCLPYWNEVINTKGQKIDNTHFYYVDNFDGIIFYAGVFPVYSQDSAYVYHLIISAESVLVSEGLGYPDVLIASDNIENKLRDSYSYAKYQDCDLISRSGDYNYASSCDAYPSKVGEVEHFEADGYDHWIRNLDKNNTIVLSKPITKAFHYLISFSYLFVSFYLAWLIFILFRNIRRHENRQGVGLKSKIQVYMVGILVVSFLLIGGAMSYFIINQYENSNRSTIHEKIQSVLIELNHKLEQEEALSPDWSGGDYPSLQALLVKFSYVFNTDINIYSPKGILLATSRPEVFRRSLTGSYMNPEAFHELSSLNRVELIHRENIGTLGYWSAYVPFYNVDKELLAYLNLPYFSRQSELRAEISTFLVAILNGYFLLILFAVFIAVLLANQLTKPLQLLQEKFSGMHLGGENTEIQYNRNDEIGGLVKAYNRMVMELQTSAEKLARSERESAWREMAKQIAHEIKNPLTPMKLSVQHLKRSWDDKVENWDSYLERVTKTLVEQIDSLTAIANEFSQFAKMPKATREKIDLAVKVENTIELFRESGESVITLEIDGDLPFMVFVDKEQIIQVLNNLITNALQSVPIGTDPLVLIKLTKREGKVVLSVTDNGSGIPENLRDKLFQPNFTTKTSGMGLGLAITKNIIDNSDGSIWFETSATGTSFFIELPLV